MVLQPAQAFRAVLEQLPLRSRRTNSWWEAWAPPKSYPVIPKTLGSLPGDALDDIPSRPYDALVITEAEKGELREEILSLREGPANRGRLAALLTPEGKPLLFKDPGQGLADLTDSFCAVKKFVYDEMSVTMATILNALEKDFEGHEDLRQRLLIQTPRYGRGDPEADAMARRVLDVLSDEASRHRSYFGGVFQMGYGPVSAQWPFGAVLGAFPGGRKAGEPPRTASARPTGLDHQRLSRRTSNPAD
ncbi:MAG: hypothetical protein JRH05_11930 [Deltaproteobacteria bacterium]|nr:hypothetical protein [Deltaproteobacteria bacterium]